MSPRTALTSSAGIAATAALLLALTGCSGAGSDDNAAPTAEDLAAGAVAVEASEPAEPAAPGLGTPITVGAFEFTASAITDLGATIGEAPLEHTAQGTFLQVDLSVANTSKKAETFLDSYVTLVDANGAMFDADSMASIYLGTDSTWVGSINPGNTLQGPIIFDVPAGTQPVSISVSDSMFSDGETILLK